MSNNGSITRAREILLSSELKLTQSEMAFIHSNQPTIGIYPLAGDDFVDYYFEWKTEDARIIVSGRGDRTKLDGATVTKKPRKLLRSDQT